MYLLLGSSNLKDNEIKLLFELPITSFCSSHDVACCLNHLFVIREEFLNGTGFGLMDYNHSTWVVITDPSKYWFDVI